MQHGERLVITDCLILESLIQGVWGRGQDCIFLSAMLHSLSDLSPQPGSGLAPLEVEVWSPNPLDYQRIPQDCILTSFQVSWMLLVNFERTTDSAPPHSGPLTSPTLHPFNNMPKPFIPRHVLLTSHQYSEVSFSKK